jgi:acyl-CoA synthetase (AMP-forming)/AMP-acid ligase II
MERGLAHFFAKEPIMPMHKTRHNPGRHNIAATLKAMIVLLGLASVGYVVVVLAEHSAPSLLNAISQSALEGQMMSLAPATKTWDSLAGVATAGVPTAPAAATATQPDVDYFPNGYVNQATKIEDPIATF